MKRVLGKPLEPRLKATDGRLVPDHPDWEAGMSLLMEALGSTDRDFVAGFVCQLTNINGDKLEEDSMTRLNFILSVIRGIKPKDQIEAMLAAQMAAVHASTMNFFRNLGESKELEYRDSAERTVNKLMRTFTTQMEALKRYRTGVQQTVNVQHVNVNDGGQAIVGNISQGEAKAPAPAEPLALAHHETIPMPNLERSRTAVAAGLKRK